ncbi:hypothetical protein CSPB12327_01765 [Campylobacter sp. RM12327]|uniref:hypothetical protein n=1 Tax=Campylobacter sputorum TaxID=206 RepID=UPI000B76FA67|nr:MULTISPECIES: hypothetical protein [Campylobacter]MBE7358068.1 hypothetical protein [Campylobacter sp. RM11302]MBF6668880.1 hypothetical protein [Campylobacter sp. RM12327]MBF6673794.1 hypothetical protein [Campylobacter sp. RM13538]MBF6676302.1 hypothetical protein [Campylobacter sp. RM12321]MBF6677709.1 hypothetical protein [Campylobacter sp. RM11259]
MKNITLKILELLYLLMAISPILIIYLIKNNYIYFSIVICIIAYIFSNLFIYIKTKEEANETSGLCNLVEIAEPKFIPIYIAYFVVSLSIEANNWEMFWLIYFIIILLICRCKFIFFNPFVLLKWSFYEAQIENNNKASYKIFIISKNNIKNIDKIPNLIRFSCSLKTQKNYSFK